MTPEAIIMLLLGGIISLFVGIVLAKLTRMEKKTDKRHDEDIVREVLLCKHRSDESRLLVEVTKAVRDGRCNGELTALQAQFEKTDREYEDFVRNQAGMKLAENR